MPAPPSVPQPSTAPAAPTRRPRIILGRQLAAMAADARAALRAATGPTPWLYVRGGELVEVIGTLGRPIVRPISIARLTAIASQVADWERAGRDAKPDRDVISALIADPDPALPHLDRVVSTPMFSASGELLTAPGYHAQHGILIALDAALATIRVPVRPTPTEIRDAIALLTTDLLGDFPFASPASCAHALAHLLVQPLRSLIAGSVPLHAHTSPTPGTGKTLLAQIPSLIITGAPPPTLSVSASGGDAEVRRTLVAVLDGAPTHLLLDNLHGRLDSAALASMLTTRQWTDRRVRTSAAPTVEIDAIIAATGNNLVLSAELARRSIWIRIDARTERPWTRGDFRHGDLVGWIAARRAELLSAILTVIQGWICAGCPRSRKTLGSFSEWAAIMGGLLEWLVVPGFLDEIEATSDPAEDELRALVAAWAAKHGSAVVTARDLAALVGACGLTLAAVRDGGQTARVQSMAAYLTTIRDRIVDTWRIEGTRDEHLKIWTYRLAKVSP